MSSGSHCPDSDAVPRDSTALHSGHTAGPGDATVGALSEHAAKEECPLLQDSPQHDRDRFQVLLTAFSAARASSSSFSSQLQTETQPPDAVHSGRHRLAARRHTISSGGLRFTQSPSGHDLRMRAQTHAHGGDDLLATPVPQVTDSSGRAGMGSSTDAAPGRHKLHARQRASSIDIRTKGTRHEF